MCSSLTGLIGCLESTVGERNSFTKEASFFNGGRVDSETAVDMDVRCSENFFDFSFEVVMRASLNIEADLRAA